MLVTEDIKRIMFESENKQFELLRYEPRSDDMNASELIRINGYTVPCIVEWDYVVTYWKDIDLGIRVITEYCTDLFDTVVHELLTEKDWVVDWIQKRQKILYEVCHAGEFNEEWMTRQLG
uniref:FBA_2 domain-containing protein n=1 Tax=Caenorhabditis tropicalis TaxID=1561998 RepID=A0A1I7UZC6_9PELO